uniref:ANK_REP_REGION domain-containing protein n=1 Tax=Caenorhabditis tropicalis TaxID=1561998 RepID=A0A1I7U942_9PELO
MPLDSPAKLEYPLHWAVFTNNQKELKELLGNRSTLEIDKLDVRGRTALMLAVTIGYFTCAKLLMEAGADASIPNKEMWSVSNEAVAQGNAEFVRNVIHHRDHQRASRGARAMRTSLEKLRDVPDFFCEMNWDFSSWVPFLSQACPSDCHKIYKKGSSVRIDTTLVSFQGTSWIRGNQSYMFRLNDQGFAEFIVLDHDERIAAIQELRDDDAFEEYRPSPSALEDRLRNTISTTYIDVDNIGFERTSRGFLSWFTNGESTENVGGYDCKVLNASNVQLVTKRRFDHLSRDARDRLAQEELNESKAVASLRKMMSMNKTDENTQRDLFKEGKLTPDQYLDPNYEFEPGSDVGKAREVVKRTNGFKATLWMADDYPLNLHDQIIPIVELMAVNSPHFARLHKFIRLQLPAGFPVKIEIPLFHIVSARIAFQNINSPGRYVSPIDDHSVEIDEEAFRIPDSYVTDEDTGRFGITWEDDDDRNMRSTRITTTDLSTMPMRQVYSDEMLLQIAIEQSLREMGGAYHPPPMQTYSDFLDGAPVVPSAETEYFRALRDSQDEADRRRREEEQFEEELRAVLELSKTEQ